MAKDKKAKAAKKKTVTRAPRAARKLKTSKFVAYTASATHLFAITKDAKCYVWNGLEGAFVPNWDVDGNMKAAIIAKQLADEAARKNAVADEQTPAAEQPAPNRHTRRAIKAVSGGGAFD